GSSKASSTPSGTSSHHGPGSTAGAVSVPGPNRKEAHAVKETIAKLVDLQRVDHKAQDLKKKREDLALGLVDAQKGVEAAKVVVEAAHKALLEARSHVHRKEL